MDVHIVMQECAVTGSSNALDAIVPYELSSTVLHHMIPSLKVDLKSDLLNLDDAYSVNEIAHTHDDNSYYPKARIMIKDVFCNVAHASHVDTYHPQHVLYCYTYIIGYQLMI